MAAYRNYETFDNRNPKSWFAMIAANKCRDFLKNPARRLTPVDTKDLEYISDGAVSVEEETERTAGNERVYYLCARLKEPYRSIAVAYYCHDETITEISNRTGDNRKTVATRLYRAKNLIKILLKEEDA